MYRITPKRGGDPFVCNESHVLSLRVTGGAKLSGFHKGRIVNVSVGEYLSWSKTAQHVCKLYRSGPVEFHGRRQKLPIQPYVLGLWLGDGSQHHPGLCSADPEPVLAWREEAQRLGLFVRDEPAGGMSRSFLMTPLKRLSGRDHWKNGGGNPFTRALSDLGLRTVKRIPSRYQSAAISERLELLAGLIDSDGYLHHNGYEIIVKNRDLASDILFVARSLGFTADAKASVKGVSGTDHSAVYQRVSITGDCDRIPVRVARKRAAARQQKKDWLVTGFDVEPLGEGTYFGFEIDGPDRLFLLGDFTVTHNTVLMAWMARAAAAKGRRTWFLVHRQELIRQASRTFDLMDVDHGLIYRGHTLTNDLVQVASVQTLVRRLSKIRMRPDLVVVDEAHHATAGTWRKILDQYPEAKVVGLTATPSRTDGSGLDDIFGDMIQGPTMSELIGEGYLAPYQLFAPPIGIDTQGIKTQGGDFKKGQLAQAVDKPTITGDAVKHYQKLAPGRRAIAFCASVDHSKHVAASFRNAGIPAAHFDGETDDATRERLTKQFGDGRIKVLCNVDLVGEGLDIPACDAVILLRPTQSLTLYLQQVGRSMRPSPGKDYALILDHAGNALRHGLPDEDREWSLEGRKKGKGKAQEQGPPVTQCPQCFACHGPAPKCPSCGHVYESQGREIEEQAGELEQVDPQELKRRRKAEQAKAETVEDLTELGRARGYRNPRRWAEHVHAARKRKSEKRAA